MSVLTEAQREYMDSLLKPSDSLEGQGSLPNEQKIVRNSKHLVTRDSLQVVDDEDHKHQSRKTGRGNHRVRSSKKGGAGGKGTWGTPMDSVGAETALDKGDPNYDSTEDQVLELVAEAVIEVRDPVTEFKERVSAIVLEYFDNADVQEACDSIEDLHCPLYQHFVVKKVVTMAMDRQQRECEMAARLLSVIFPNVVCPDEMTKGFIQLLNCAEDLALDVPEAGTILGIFISRAVVDDILPPAFVNRALGLVSEDRSVATAALQYCKVQLGARHAAERVLRLWGDSVGLTVDDAKQKIALLLAEYSSSRDAVEAQQCLHALQLPFFHHEVVKKALTSAIENPDQKQAFISLLSELGKTGEVSQTQMTMGFTRMLEAVEDLSLDVPDATTRLNELIEEAKSHSILDASFGQPAPLESEM
mmetsp:Transcript_22551/g.31394  ORF Transcript_22551/g.31394 Transcript_22551/m.31394 type:complete len:417 (+) Transcript_22551:223-1473(+)